jgi:hypothetical protein
VTAARARVAGPADARGAVKAAVCATARAVVTERFAGVLRALVLTGSVARDEGTVMADGAAVRLLGDAEFLVVLNAGRRLSAVAVEKAARAIERRLQDAGIAAHVSLAAVPPAFLRGLRPAIFAYELRACGEVVHGDRAVLRLVPPFAAAAIPREDAWRLLCNRLIEDLDPPPSRGGAMPADAYYRTVKLYLDLATSLLVFAGAYAPSYAARAERLRALAGEPAARSRVPFSLGELSARVDACTAFKLAGGPPPATASWEFREEAIAWAERLWRWEMSELTGLPAGAPVPDLIAGAMARQPLRQRLRGWLQVARAQGWLAGWRDRARWPRLLWRGSPRYWVYAAAAALAFGRASADAAPARHESWRRRLPVIPPAGEPEAPAARRLAHDLAWNYRTYLVQTRS